MIEDIDKTYRLQIENTPKKLARVYNDLKNRGPLPLEGTEVTHAVLLRLASYYKAQYSTIRFLGKRRIGAGSDFFVETVLFFVNLLNETHDLEIEVLSESDIRPVREGQKGAIRPDISIKTKDRLKVVVECKTQLGYNRDNWQSDFYKREEGIHDWYPRARLFLLVMTAAGWKSKNAIDDFMKEKDVGKKIFVLSRIWPTEITDENVDGQILHRLEELLIRVENACK